jgi:hypothetical protein
MGRGGICAIGVIYVILNPGTFEGAYIVVLLQAGEMEVANMM